MKSAPIVIIWKDIFVILSQCTDPLVLNWSCEKLI